MTTTRAPLTDSALRNALLELAAGPDAGRLETDVLRAVAATAQVRPLAWPAIADRRRFLLVAVAALLAAALVGTLLAGAMTFNRLLAIPGRPLVLAVQQWNRQGPEQSIVSHTAFAAGGTSGVALPGLPPNVVGVRWSPDGARVVYFETEITVREGGPRPGARMAATDPFIANGDGTAPVGLSLPHPPDAYLSYSWYGGPIWAPGGQHVALPWNTGSCEGSTDCVPPSGIDIFDRAGRLVVAIETPGNVSQSAYWSGDGSRMLWTSGACVDGSCIDDTVHWRGIEGDPAITSFPGVMGGYVWPEDNRIHAVAFDADGATGVVTMAPDGSDLQAVPWDLGNIGPVWSPDGRWLAQVDDQTSVALARELATGREVRWTVPASSYIGAWSPDSRSIAVVGPAPDETSSDNAFYVLSLDDGQVTAAGLGTDFTWVPPALLP